MTGTALAKVRLRVPPAAQKDVVGPDHGQGQQAVQAGAVGSGLRGGDPLPLHVPQDELPPRGPLLAGLTEAPQRVHPPRQMRVLLQVLRDRVVSAPLRRHPRPRTPAAQSLANLIQVRPEGAPGGLHGWTRTLDSFRPAGELNTNSSLKRA